MIYKWNHFVKETDSYNQLYQLLLEGTLDFGDEFIDMIGKLQDKRDPVADKILKIYNKQTEHDDEKLKYNFVDLTGKEDLVSFISQKKINQMEEKDPYVDEYDNKSRAEVKVGRLVRAIFELEKVITSDKEIETFVNLFKSMNGDTDKEEFKLVKERNIKYWYHIDNYFDGDDCPGELGNSCMADSDCQGYFDIYTDNPKRCHLLILTVKDDGEEKLIGRALIWKMDKSPCDAKYLMDRVYTMKGSDINKFRHYADKEGWMYRKFNTSDQEEALQFIYKGKTVVGKVEVELDGDCDEYPYMDTLSWLNDDKDMISNVGFKDGYMLRDTDGERDRCDNCDGDGCDQCVGILKTYREENED